MGGYEGGRDVGARVSLESHLRGRRDLEPQSLAGTVREDAPPADRRRLGVRPESVAEAAARLREEARIDRVREMARRTGVSTLIARPAPPEEAPQA